MDLIYKSRGPLVDTAGGPNREISSRRAHAIVVAATLRLRRERELEAQPFTRAPAVPDPQERACVQPMSDGGWMRVKMHKTHSQMRMFGKSASGWGGPGAVGVDAYDVRTALTYTTLGIMGSERC